MNKKTWDFSDLFNTFFGLVLLVIVVGGLFGFIILLIDSDNLTCFSDTECYTDEQLKEQEDTYIAEQEAMLDAMHQVDCEIKGNISFKTQEKIYHTPVCYNYDDVEINEEYGEKWFCTEKEAQDAGRRKAYNCDY